MSTGRKTNGGEHTHVLPERVKRTILRAHRHCEKEEEGRALGEPYAHFLFDPSFLKMTVKLNYSVSTHTHTHTYEQHSKQTSVGEKGEKMASSQKVHVPRV